jgi:hypothetical protein
MAPSKIIQTPSRFFITRLNSGKLLLVKHGPVAQNVGRSQLMAFLSDDDGQTWSKGLILDERTLISYPDGLQTPDGTIYVTYDRSREGDKEILMTTFTEKDVEAGAYVTAGARQKVIVNKAGGAFEENFKNDGTVDALVSQIGWKANYGTGGAAVSESNASFVNGPVLSWVDFIVYKLDPAVFGSKPFLLWTDKTSFGVIDRISCIKVSLKNDEQTADLKVAIKVDDKWYVTKEVLNAGVADWTVHTLNVHSVSWNALSFIPGQMLVEGGAIRLPASGTVQAIGIFDADETGVKTRVGRFVIQ